jgi:uncharacterized delta-60 repeat protein
LSLRARVALVLFGLSFAVLSTFPAAAAGGDLDPGFGGDGIVTTDMGKSMDIGLGIAIQGDDKAVVVGAVGADRKDVRFGVARYDLDGSLDATFGGGDGMVVTNFTPGDDEATAVAIQADGKIVVAGFAGPRIGIARYTTSGGLDPTFGGDGKVTTDLTPKVDYAWAVAIQESDDKIVVGGFAAGAGGRFAVARYDTGGTLDATFGGGDGWVATNFTPKYDYIDDLAIQADGKIVATGVANYFSRTGGVALARYDANGTLDPGFNGDWKILANLGPGFDGTYAVAVQPGDQKIVAAGETGRRFVVLRYDTAGAPDATFNGDGKAITNFTPGSDYADEVLVQGDGNIVAAGATDYFGRNGRFALVRYGANGVLDSSFSGDGKVMTNISKRTDRATGLGIQSDGKLVAGGYARFPTDSRFALVRYLGA